MTEEIIHRLLTTAYYGFGGASFIASLWYMPRIMIRAFYNFLILCVSLLCTVFPLSLLVEWIATGNTRNSTTFGFVTFLLMMGCSIYGGIGYIVQEYRKEAGK